MTTDATPEFPDPPLVDPPLITGRPLPALTAENAFHFRAAAQGRLELQRCGACGAWTHPPLPACRVCGADDVVPVALDGDGVVVAFTHNHQTWNPAQPAPYTLVLVEPVGAPGVRLTAELVDVDPLDTDAVRVGQPVTARFVRLTPGGGDDGAGDDAIGIVQFAPTPEIGDVAVDEADAPMVPTVHVSTLDEPPERSAVISGVGRSRVGRRLGRSNLSLTVEAARRALADAGLEPSDVDGLATYPGWGVAPPGYTGPDLFETVDALGLRCDWLHAAPAGAGQLGAVVAAALAVHAGLARHVLVYRTVTESSDRTPPPPGPVGSQYAWLAPSGAYSAANWLAMYAMRYLRRYGVPREELAAVVLNGRANAAANPDAPYRDPLTLDDYLSARMISTPLGLLDCDVPIDGATAVVVSHRDTAADLRAASVGIEAVGTALHGRPLWDQWEDLTTMASDAAASSMWARTDLGPDDVDVAQCYDGFSILAVLWAESLGLCGRGEGSALFASQGRSLNTDGGQLSGGRLHGFGLLHEAVLQLRGTAGERQVDGATVAVTTAGGGPMCGSLLLTARSD